MKCQRVTTLTANRFHPSPQRDTPHPEAGTFSALTTTPIALYHVCNFHRHQFYMYNNFPFICQVNICKSYTHINQIIIMITNIFFPYFIA